MTAGEATSTKRPKRPLRARKQTLKELAEEIASEIMSKQEARKAAQAVYWASRPDATAPSLISTIAHSEYDEHGLPINGKPAHRPVDRSWDLGTLWRTRGR